MAAVVPAAMVSNPVHGLPFLPGTSFKDSTVRSYLPDSNLSPPSSSPGGFPAQCTSIPLHSSLLSNHVFCPDFVLSSRPNFCRSSLASFILPLQSFALRHIPF